MSVLKPIEDWLDQMPVDEKEMKRSLTGLLPHLVLLGQDDCDNAVNLLTIGTGIAKEKLYTAIKQKKNPKQPKIAPKQKQTITGTELLKLQLPEPVWVVPGFVCEGVSLLVGKPKMGKSWLCLDYATSASFGGYSMGCVKVPRVDVLYISLEDNDRRLQSRLKKVLAEEGTEDLPNLHFATNWPKGDDGVKAIREHITENPECKLIIIDTLSKFRAQTKTSGNVYQDDYATIEPIKKLADELKVAVILVHHTRKAVSDDVFDEVSGSTGLTGSVDTTMLLKRERGQMDAALYITGRDVEEAEKALMFNSERCKWQLLGDVVEYQTDKAGVDILNILKASQNPVSVSELVKQTGKTDSYVNKLLSQLFKEKLITRVSKGLYTYTKKDQGRVKAGEQQCLTIQ